MAQTIKHFSGVQWTNKINNIINPNSFNDVKNNSTINKTKNSKILGKKEAINIINKKLSLNINDNNTGYSSINALVSQWSFNISNTKFDNDYYIILEDQGDKILYYFYLKNETIKEPKKIFNQRNDNRVQNKSIIIIPKHDKSFANNWQGNEFSLIKYKILEIKY